MPRLSRWRWTLGYETASGAQEAEHGAATQGEDIASCEIHACGKRQGPEGSAADAEHKRCSANGSKVVPAKILRVSGSANGLLGAVSAAKAKRIEPTRRNPLTERRQHRRGGK